MSDNTPSQQGYSCEFHVVGIGASAGGVEAIETLFENMPEDSGMAFVVVQHLSPDFKSHMKELLERKTAIPIHRVENRVQVEPNNIYLIPPKKEMVISGGRLCLTERSKERSLTHPIDQFFRSLAHDCGRYAIGIILSGTGSDGSRGIQDIKDISGLVLCQDEQSARFDGMPINAMATGATDLVLHPRSMSEALHRYVRHNLSPEVLANEQLEEAAVGVDEVFELLRQSSNVDFSHYKASTVSRRVQRRMTLVAVSDIEAYCQYMRKHPEEVDELCKDLLIGVTQFFRDDEAFQYLESDIIPRLVSRAQESGVARVWVAGCASGEEAYSIAIMLEEVRRRSGESWGIKVFATDIHPGSLKKAMRGTYDEAALEGISKDLREKYFHKKEDRFEIDSGIRSHIVFALHNVINDSPFTQLDMISCRNLLIYLQPLAQKKVLSLFHFGLKAEGVVFLGSSETLGELADEFDTLNSRCRFYAKRRNVRLPADTRMPIGSKRRMQPLSWGPVSEPKVAAQTDGSLLKTYDRLLDEYMPPSILIDDQFEILHTFGGAEKFLSYRGGRPTNGLLEAVEEDLTVPLTGALQHALRDRVPVQYTGLRIKSESGVQDLSLAVTPLDDPRTKFVQLLVRFMVKDIPLDPQVEPVPVDVSEMAQQRINSLETELRFSRENLQAAIEELETANEELQSANEAMLTSNEELQSSNEELQSVNEELFTVNTEHQQKIDQLTLAKDDMDNLLALTRVGVIYLDDERCIRQFTPEIGRLFHLLPQDAGRPIDTFAHNFAGCDLTALIDQAQAESEQVEERVLDREGHPYLLRIAPYRRTVSTSGVVMTLIDVAELDQAHSDAATFKLMSEQAVDLHLLTNSLGQILYANPAAGAALGYELDDLLELRLSDLSPDIEARWVQGFARSDAEGLSGERTDAELITADNRVIYSEVSLSRVDVGSKNLVFVAIRDVSERRKRESDLRLYQSAIEAAMSGVTIVDAQMHDHPIVYVNEGFTRITGYSVDESIGRNCRFLQSSACSPESRKKIRDGLAEGRHVRVTLLNETKDGRPFWNDLNINPVHDVSGKLTHFVGIQTDVTANIDAELHAKQRAARLRALLDSTAEGIFGLDQEGRVTFCNNSALQLLGLGDAAEVPGMTLQDLVGTHRGQIDERGGEHDRFLDAVISGQVLSQDHQWFWDADGMPIPVKVCVQPIEHDSGPLGAVVSFVDTTEAAEQEQRLRKARRDADSANRAKSEFLANMSHEIRTPLAAIMAFADLLRIDSLIDERSNHIDGIRRNARSLLDIVNDILDLSKVEADQIEIREEKVDLPSLLSDLYSGMGVRAAEKGLGLDFICETPIPKVIASDQMRVRQILMNLIGNAIKFTHEGGVEVRLRFDALAHELSVTVVDSGIGIAEEVRSRLFTPFHQADPSIERRFGGTGLGLSITKRLVEKLGGEISLKSTVGVGSSFCVRLSVGTNAGKELVADFTAFNRNDNELDQLPPKLVAGQILLIDDQKDIRESAAAILRTSGAKVRVAASGDAGIRALRDEAELFDLVLLDLQMPRKSGFDTIKEIRALGFRKPVIAFTAQAMKGDNLECLKAGFDDYVSKPIQIHKFLPTVRKHLTSDRVDTKLKVLVVEDHEDSGKALMTLLDSPQRNLRRASSGMQAIELVAQFVPDVCLLDLGLPDMSGFELGERLNKLPSLANCRFVATTGRTDDSTAKEARERGFERVFPKPYRIDEIVEYLESVGPSSPRDKRD